MMVALAVLGAVSFLGVFGVLAYVGALVFRESRETDRRIRELGCIGQIGHKQKNGS